MERAAAISPKHRLDDLAEALPQRAAVLSRLFIANSSVPMSRTEAGVLSALQSGPVRITELAKREGVTQPAISLLVNRFEARGWVQRESDPGDGRAVLVGITPVGDQVFNELRARYRALLHEEMASLDPVELDTLASAVQILDRLIARLQVAAR